MATGSKIAREDVGEGQHPLASGLDLCQGRAPWCHPITPAKKWGREALCREAGRVRRLQVWRRQRVCVQWRCTRFGWRWLSPVTQVPSAFWNLRGNWKRERRHWGETADKKGARAGSD